MSNAEKTIERRKIWREEWKKDAWALRRNQRVREDGEKERNEREGCTDGAKVEDDTDGVKEKYDKG